jgi:UDP:flavonoid glycosyltransferase YjiC (YdhE family)
MAGPVIAAFSMPDRGHFQRLRPVVSGLRQAGARVLVFTHEQFAPEVIEDGAEFVDLFAGRDIDRPGDDSWPRPVRYMTFAGAWADDVVDSLRARRVSLVLYDTFATIGSVAAQMLGVPRVNVCAGHAVVPERFLEVLRAHPRVHVSDVCRRAIAALDARMPGTGLSPFAYATALSPHLNIYCEPPQFLPPADRPVFEPVSCFGSLSEAQVAAVDGDAKRGASARWFGEEAQRRLKVFVSFGTNIWVSRATEAVAALGAIAGWAGSRRDVAVLIALGGSRLSAGEQRSLARANVRVVDYVDQWDVLAGADAFVTHHGLNSTHEAIAREVPMLSYPFVWDQPGLAARCQQLGLAVTTVDRPMAPLDAAGLDAAFTALAERQHVIGRALAEAHGWEQEVVARRPAAVGRILSLA